MDDTWQWNFEGVLYPQASRGSFTFDFSSKWVCRASKGAIFLRSLRFKVKNSKILVDSFSFQKWVCRAFEDAISRVLRDLR